MLKSKLYYIFVWSRLEEMYIVLWFESCWMVGTNSNVQCWYDN